eukprot:8134546-Pyramimonas_sp.AAC.1
MGGQHRNGQADDDDNGDDDDNDDGDDDDDAQEEEEEEEEEEDWIGLRFGRKFVRVQTGLKETLLMFLLGSAIPAEACYHRTDWAKRATMGGEGNPRGGEEEREGRRYLHPKPAQTELGTSCSRKKYASSEFLSKSSLAP